MKRAFIIGICGKKRSGKNTAADALISAFRSECECAEMSFAEPIKRCASELFGFSREQLDGDEKEVPDPRWEGLTPRRIVQFFGTEMMQFKIQEILPGVGRHFWCHRLIKRIHDLPQDTLVVVTDLRFKHEQEALKTTFGDRFICLKVERYHDDHHHQGGGDCHLSEMEVQDICADVIVKNNSDRESFQKECVDVLKQKLNIYSIDRKHM